MFVVYNPFNLLYPQPPKFRFGLFLPIWCLSTLINYYFKIFLHLKEIFYVVKMTPNIYPYRDVLHEAETLLHAQLFFC